MDEYRTQQYEAEEEPRYDWDYSEAPPPPNILWGRVAALVGAIVVFFLIGRATADRGIPEERYEQVKSQLASTQREVNRLEDQLQAAQREATNQGSEDVGTTGEEDQGRPLEKGARIYTVKPGDTLTTIAERFYQDAERADLIAAANNIDDPSEIEIGQELIIPKLDETEETTGATEATTSEEQTTP